MAYTILNPDGTTLALLADGTIDQITTTLTLIGKDYNSYGQYFNNNFITLLANSAGDTDPRSPIRGQLWYNVDLQKLQIFDGEWKQVSGATVSNVPPNVRVSGDLWFDSIGRQLHVSDGDVYMTIGPSRADKNNTGWFVVNAPFKDRPGYEQSNNFSVLKTHNRTIGSMSTSSFTMDPSTYQTFEEESNSPSTTSTVVAGLNIYGDIHYTGNITNKHVSLSVNIDSVSPGDSDVSDAGQAIMQNIAIIDILTLMFTPNYSQNGITTNTEARVLCHYANPTVGYQVRQFVVDDNGQWRATTISAGPVLNLLT
jgi:hypothetical protein